MAAELSICVTRCDVKRVNDGRSLVATVYAAAGAP